MFRVWGFWCLGFGGFGVSGLGLEGTLKGLKGTSKAVGIFLGRGGLKV